MTNINELLDDFDDDDVYYDPNISSLVPEGTYPARIVGLSVHKVSTKTKGKAVIYKPIYQIDDNVHNCGGREVKDYGQWRFRGSKDEEGRRITGGSNTNYKKFLDKLHIPLQKLELEGNSGDEPRVVVNLPSITEDLLLDKSVVISVGHDEWSGKYGRQITAAANLVRVRNGSANEQEY